MNGLSSMHPIGLIVIPVGSSTVWSVMSSLGSEASRWHLFQLPNCWRWCAGWNNAGRWKPLIGRSVTCGQVFRYAVATGRAEQDPSAAMRGALPPVKGGHFAALTDPKQIGPLLLESWTTIKGL